MSTHQGETMTLTELVEQSNQYPDGATGQRLRRVMIRGDEISGSTLCQMVWEQPDKAPLDTGKLAKGTSTPFVPGGPVAQDTPDPRKQEAKASGGSDG